MAIPKEAMVLRVTVIKDNTQKVLFYPLPGSGQTELLATLRNQGYRIHGFGEVPLGTAQNLHENALARGYQSNDPKTLFPDLDKQTPAQQLVEEDEWDRLTKNLPIPV